MRNGKCHYSLNQKPFPHRLPCNKCWHRALEIFGTFDHLVGKWCLLSYETSAAHSTDADQWSGPPDYWQISHQSIVKANKIFLFILLPQQLDLPEDGPTLCRGGWTKLLLKVSLQPKLFCDSVFLLQLSKGKYFRLNSVWQNRGKKQLSKHVDINSLLSQLLQNQESQKNRMVEVGMDLLTSACPTLLLKQDHLKPVWWTAA